jgi:hypothetical protein
VSVHILLDFFDAMLVAIESINSLTRL